MVLGEVVHDRLHLRGEFGGLALELSLLDSHAAVVDPLGHGVLLGFADDVEDEGEIEGVMVTLVLELAGVLAYLGEGFLGEDLGFGFEGFDAGFARLDELLEDGCLDEGVGGVEVDVVGSDDGCG